MFSVRNNTLHRAAQNPHPVIFRLWLLVAAGGCWAVGSAGLRGRALKARVSLPGLRGKPWLRDPM